MRKYITWAYLNDAGKAVWGEVFLDGEVTVQSIVAQPATLEGITNTEHVFLVDWKELGKQQQDSVLEKLSKLSDAGKDVILNDVQKIGLPLLEKYTEGCGTTRLGLFVLSNFLVKHAENRSQNASLSKSKVKFDFCTVRKRVISILKGIEVKMYPA